MILVMKNVLAILLSLFWACPSFAADTAPSAQELQLKDQMRGLMQAFQNLECPLGRKPPDYDEILKLLDEMNTRAKTVQSLKGSGHPGKEFKKLFRDIEDFKKSAQAKSPSGVEDSMNRLAENCFRCHLSHN
jgi:cytochrome c556